MVQAESLCSDVDIRASLREDMRSFLLGIRANHAGVLLALRRHGPGLVENSMQTSPCAYIHFRTGSEFLVLHKLLQVSKGYANPQSVPRENEGRMNIFYIIGVIVVVLFILGYLGLR